MDRLRADKWADKPIAGLTMFLGQRDSDLHRARLAAARSLHAHHKWLVSGGAQIGPAAKRIGPTISSSKKIQPIAGTFLLKNETPQQASVLRNVTIHDTLASRSVRAAIWLVL